LCIIRSSRIKFQRASDFGRTARRVLTSASANGSEVVQCNSITAAITPLSLNTEGNEADSAMLKHDPENSAPKLLTELLTDEQLEVVSGGLFVGPPWVLGGGDPTQPHAIPGTFF